MGCKMTARESIKTCSGIDCPLKSLCKLAIMAVFTGEATEHYKYDAASGCTEFVERGKE